MVRVLFMESGTTNCLCDTRIELVPRKDEAVRLDTTDYHVVAVGWGFEDGLTAGVVIELKEGV